MSQRDKSPEEAPGGLSRRMFLKGAGVAAGGVLGAQAAAAEVTTSQAGGRRLSGKVPLTLRINGLERELSVEPRTTLLSALRVHLDPPLTGTKSVCERGGCGACTVLLDGEAGYSCSTLAVDAVGREVRTVEGLGSPDDLSVVQQAFWEEDALMCGFCTPGFVVSVTGCLERNPKADLDEVRAACAGNLCKCGTVPHVFKAALSAGKQLARGGK